MKKEKSSNSGYITIPLKKGDIQRFNISAGQIIVIGGTLWAKVQADDSRFDTAECNRLFWKTQKQEQRHARCIVYTEKTGRIIKCRKKCSECEREFRLPYVSLDNIQEKKPELFTYEEEGYGQVDAECTYDKIMSKLRDINPTYADSLHRFYTTGDCNISKLARKEGVAISTMHERIHRAKNLVRLIYDGEISIHEEISPWLSSPITQISLPGITPKRLTFQEKCDFKSKNNRKNVIQYMAAKASAGISQSSQALITRNTSA